MYRDPRNNSLAHQAQVGAIVGRSDEIKGYCIYLRKDKVVIVVQHVKNIEEPINKTIEQQQHSHGTEEDTSLSRNAADKNEITAIQRP